MKRYRGVIGIFGHYWAAYGGTPELIRSPYLHVALLLTFLTFPFWTAPGWWDTVIGVLPNMLGFTLGGFAMFIGFGEDWFKKAITSIDSTKPNKASYYIEASATFVHFIVVQVLALIAAVLGKSWATYMPWPEAVARLLPSLNVAGGFIGFGLFMYAMTSALAATMQIFRISRLYTTLRPLLAPPDAPTESQADDVAAR